MERCQIIKLFLPKDSVQTELTTGPASDFCRKTWAGSHASGLGRVEPPRGRCTCPSPLRSHPVSWRPPGWLRWGDGEGAGEKCQGWGCRWHCLTGTLGCALRLPQSETNSCHLFSFTILLWYYQIILFFLLPKINILFKVTLDNNIKTVIEKKYKAQ